MAARCLRLHRHVASWFAGARPAGCSDNCWPERISNSVRRSEGRFKTARQGQTVTRRLMMARFFNSRPYGGGTMSVLQCNSITNNHSIRVALYARVSSEQQAQAGTIDSQVAAIMQRLQQDDATIDDEARFIDEGHSGATLVRPALERLRDLASAGGIDRLYVLCPDRLARSYAYQMLLVDELQRCGVELVFVNRDL